MGRTTEDSVDFAEVDNIEEEEMPKPTRGYQGMTETVKQLVVLIEDKKVHRIKNATEETKNRWSRKLRYAARRAGNDKGMDVEIVHVPDGTDRLPGVYFRGYERGKAPKRGLRK